MPHPSSFGDLQLGDESLPRWEIVQRGTFLKPGRPTLEKGEATLSVDQSGYSCAKANYTLWSATVERHDAHSSVHVAFSLGIQSRQFYVLISPYGDLKVSHPEVASIQRTVNGVQIELIGVGVARRREAWKDSDLSRNVVGYIEIQKVDHPDFEPLLAWVCYVVGTMAYVPNSD